MLRNIHLFGDLSQINLLICFLILFAVYIYFNRKISKTKLIFVIVAFVYAYLLVNISFFPLREVFGGEDYNFLNGNYFNLISESFNYKEIIFGNVLLLVPAGILVSYFKNGFKTIFAYGILISVGIEILQLLFTYLSVYFGFGIVKVIGLDHILAKFIGFCLGVAIYKITFLIIKK